MSDQSSPALPKWPFYLGDLLLLLVAGLIYWQGNHAPWQGQLRFLPWEAWALVACVALGATLGVWPHLLEHRAAARLAEAQHLDHAVLQVQNIEAVARQISSATAGWQAVQDDATKAVQSAAEIAESITTEARSFQDFLAKANETEKNHLRLEVEKLRRGEAEWLQVLTRILDHTYAIHQAAVRSGQPGLMEQLDHFQRACRDAARRVGLVPFVASAGEAFSPQTHQLADADAPVPPDPVVADTLAPGIRYQGRVARLPLVALKGAREDGSDLSLRAINHRREQIGITPPITHPASPPSDPAPSAKEPARAEPPEEVATSGAFPDPEPRRETGLEPGTFSGNEAAEADEPQDPAAEAEVPAEGDPASPGGREPKRAGPEQESLDF
jgi:molecular chaperone GrpE (heat shock protein)